jgi:DNA polymerase-3 subunit epsilon/ATP-dependent DNA helicase DinG
MSRIYVALDLETTGFSPERDAILEIGAVKFRVPTHPDESAAITDRWSTLVHPDRPIPYRIRRLTGITQAEANRAPRLPQVLDELRAFVGNYPVVGHNVAFELAFLQRHNLLKGQAHLDTFELSSILLPDAPRYSLGQLASYLTIEFDGWHRALADAEMAARLFMALWDEARILEPSTLESIVKVAIESQWSLRSFFAATLRAGHLSRAAAPRPLRARPASPSGPLAHSDGSTRLPLDEISSLLGAEGRVTKGMPGYETRPEQVAMLNSVARAFDEGRHLLIEAGTGTGKSLAYALAAIYQATTRGEPVVIATHTLPLQDQLFYEELPFLSASLDRPFTAARLKGRTNYVCARRVEMLRRRGNFSEAEARLLARVLVWLQRTESGDRSELNIQSDEEPVWQLLYADPETCRGDNCTPYGICYWQRARAQAEGAHLIIVNHALLLSDIVAGGGLIPPYKYLIVDEAHHLEEQATQQFGFSLSAEQIFLALARVGFEYQGRDSGLLALIRRHAREQHGRRLEPLAERCGLLLRQVDQCRHSAALLFETLADFLKNEQAQDNRYRVVPEWQQQGGWRQLAQAVGDFRVEMGGLAEGLAATERELRSLSMGDPLWQDMAEACHTSAVWLMTLSEEADRILLQPDGNDVIWIAEFNGEEGEEESGAGRLTLNRAPLDVSSLLRERLFEQKQSVVLTSATLSIEGSFAFVRERLGVTEARELSLGSPYNFHHQALVYVASDLPEPNQPHYASNLQRAIVELARATDGRMLVLFTSKSQLRAAYRAISDPLAQHDIVVLGQYMDGSRTQLLERFRTMERAVLLGTHSFWEGVDIPGPALSCLVITRLPFPVPTDPVQEARSRHYHDPFHDYSVPQAVIRFRQGFGRLLRATSDRGIIALLDSRLDSKQYGRIFLNSLPTTLLHVGPFRDLPPLASRWLKEEPTVEARASEVEVPIRDGGR